MYRVTVMLTARWSQVTARVNRDRGEFGPISYALMVAFAVLLAGAIIAWGRDLADQFMGQLDDFDFDDPGPAQ